MFPSSIVMVNWRFEGRQNSCGQKVTYFFLLRYYFTLFLFFSCLFADPTFLLPPTVYGYFNQVPDNVLVHTHRITDLNNYAQVKRMFCFLTSGKLTLLFIVVLICVVHSKASTETISGNLFTDASIFEGGDSMQLPVAQQVEPPPIGITRCSFHRFTNNLRRLVNFRSVYPYIFIFIFTFNLIFNPFLILWVVISPIFFNIIGSTALCFALPVSTADNSVRNCHFFLLPTFVLFQ